MIKKVAREDAIEIGDVDDCWHLRDNTVLEDEIFQR
jgi:hypothetical protein